MPKSFEIIFLKKEKKKRKSFLIYPCFLTSLPRSQIQLVVQF